MLNLTSYTHGTIQYDDLLRDFNEHMEKMKLTTLSLHQAIEANRTLVVKKNEEFPEIRKKMEEKKIELQQAIAKMRRNVVQEQQDLDAIQQALAPRELERTEKIQERHRQFEFLVEKKNQLHNRIRQKRQEQSKVIKAETDNALLTELELDTFRRALQLEIVNTYEAIRFEFKCINKQVPEKIYHVALTITEANVYTVIACQPDSVLPKVLKELDVLNQDRELFDFIKKLRQIFRQSANA
ncbi:hypothetical protein FB192DRAFT_1381839 [Mucor lusitanicus]|uniref:Kinetochore protein SPC25 n=1 Tax=Mucor circinelloides f. lusitanicus TaxID=29924 RepID=A0A8H4BFY4_MUCCL|nr:hypothetical protein FB192DRAFT_1381839 [Mucor lusitanicus]